LIYSYGLYDYVINKDNDLQLLLLEYKYIRLFVFLGLGLVCGLIGDLFLEVQYFYNKKKFYQINQGMIVFLLGHIFYILGMSFFMSFSYWSLLVGAIMTGVVYLGSKLMKIQFGKLASMSYIYTFVIFTMVGLAVIKAFELNFSGFSLSFMLGAIFFGISDLVLAPIYFQEKSNPVFAIINLSTYYLGQVLIALSISFL
jgi:uncharacterized membrane protein YhhN